VPTPASVAARGDGEARHRRRIAGDAGAVRHAEAGGPLRLHGADPGRERHGQGADRAGAARARVAGLRPLRPGQLRDPVGRDPGERAVRPREGTSPAPTARSRG
jgi:hypothetical protein